MLIDPRDFAANIGITFKTPEEFFLGKPPEPVSRAFDPSVYIKEESSGPGKSRFHPPRFTWGRFCRSARLRIYVFLDVQSHAYAVELTSGLQNQ